ncbi:TIGR04222 domain-containing membrane protein [Streptomyces sp. NPDC097619]|uniref:TIGR04222 domain-containing membrane protein n=1 Tax=Streptomyces sp. NPDC097619 TaxID=3157228 RepID=UPI0033331DA4
MFWIPLLLVAWTGALLACTRLLRAATGAADRAAREAEARAGVPDDGSGRAELTLYEAAYLAGGPQRVAVLVLLSMQRRRRLLLAHTGWATVVDPVGRDPLERSLLGAFGPDGQLPVSSARSAVAAGPAVRALGDRLGAAGLAVPEEERVGYVEGVRSVRLSSLLTTALAALALALPPPDADRTLLLCWFSLPLILTLCCLGISRFDGSPRSSWASPAGQRLLTGLAERSRDRPDPERGYLTAVAVRGEAAVTDPGLRAALSGGRADPTAHGGR